jgi:hypothetical protein
MSVQKQKSRFQQINAKLGKRLIAWHTLSLQTPVVLSVIALGLVLYIHPLPGPTPIDSQKTAAKKSVTRQVAAPSKATQPVAAAPKATPATPSSPPPTPAKTVKPPAQAGTPKPEPVVTPAPSSNVSGLTPTVPAPTPASSPVPSSPQTTTGYTSTNWSGYLAATGSFTGISGSWTATLATGNGLTTSADSTWIGIGGVTSGDLIQVGTQNIISASGQVSTSAFYELLPNVSQPVPGVTVSPGDSLTASLSEVSSGQWTISITDKTDGEADTFSVSYASSLSSAEWIEEDPSYSFRRQIPFDNFHEAAFTGGSAVANGSTVTIAASTAQPVTMVENTSQIFAVPSAIGSDGASFTITP